MGKKGTKRKTKWRALPLGEEAGGSGNEEELHDEDQSTTSSVVGGQLINIHFKRQSLYHRMADKPYRQTRRFDRFRIKEPLVKLESKTFDEEEYTKITTPRQDVLFKKGYFGRKRESSMEESFIPSGEVEGEEQPMMDQIIITNGFVDERGHYLVNGNSYEIYDPYSNTVTVVVGPPPYANGVTQPVLAAVSCQPVPLQPVDWYPPGADWPSQGSAWTPSFARNPHSDSMNVPDGAPSFPTPDSQIPNLYNQPAYIMQGYAYSESPLFNGVPPQTSAPTEVQNLGEENKPELKKKRRKSSDPLVQEEEEKEKEEVEEKAESNQTIGEEVTSEQPKKSPAIPQDKAEIAVSTSPSPQFFEDQNKSTEQVTQMPNQFRLITPKQVEKQSHSTQTNVLESSPQLRVTLPGKESHSTQTPPEDTYQNNKIAQEKNNNILTKTPISPHIKPEGETKSMWKPQGNRYGNSVRKFREEFPKNVCQQRTNFSEERKLSLENSDSCSVKVSYAKKAMSGLENLNSKVVNGSPGKLMNGGLKNQTPVMNGIHQFTPNGMNVTNNAKKMPGYEDKRNGYVRTKNTRGKYINDRTSQKFLEKKFEVKPLKKSEKKCEESRSQSEKSSTVSELSSPTELSSGQNTPPEKLIVQEMEEEINKSLEEKLKLNFTKTKEVESDKIVGKKIEEKSKGKKKKNKEKPETGKTKEPEKGSKKKKKRTEEEMQKKSDTDNSSEEIPFLTTVRQKDLLFGSWEGLKDNDQDFISEMDSLLNGGQEILKSLGLNDDKTTYSKLPLHSDLLMMLPTFGWSRPKLKIEDFFAPAPFHGDFFTKRNITNMKSTKPEEFFASIIDCPAVDKTEKKRESTKKLTKSEEATVSVKRTSKSGGKVSKNATKKSNQSVEEKKVETEVKDGKLGIVEAVNTWLQEQTDSEKFISVESLENRMTKEEISEEEIDQKNGESNPIHALSSNADSAIVADFRKGSGCIRVANVVNDGFMHVSGEFPTEKNCSRMYRSSSWDAKLSEVNIKKHFKFLTDSASFCQDLISDVRNGLPIGNEYATEEFCDPKQAVMKYYTLTPNGRMRNESVSENEVFDALEYKFLAKENQEEDGKCPDGNGNASITDSGVHSDMESSEDNVTEQQRETTCKLQ